MSETATTTTTEKGVIRAILADKGMGFITCIEAPDAVFFRKTVPHFNDLKVGDLVEFARQDMSKARLERPKMLDIAQTIRFVKKDA